MTATNIEDVKSLHQQISAQEKEIAALKAQLGGAGDEDFIRERNERTDGIIFVVILTAVVLGLVLWLSGMPG